MGKNFLSEIIVPVKQFFKGELDIFDPDSSPYAIEYFKKIYGNSDWKLIDEFDFNNLEKTSNRKGFSRLHIRLNHESSYRNTGMFWMKFKLSGDTEFNFNENKEKYLRKKNMSVENKKLLEECSSKHHTLLNMSLLPTTGSLNVLKSRLSVPNDGVIIYSSNHTPECLDRQDTFISALNDYFNNRKNELILSKSGKNREPLINYLNEFSNIYDYCNKVLFIKDKSLVNLLIENGAKPINTESDVLNYINIAQQYWEEKEKNILSLFE